MKVDIAIRGMHCASCVRAVEEAARSVPGVRGAEVNFAAERAALEVEPGEFRAPARRETRPPRG